MIVREKRSPMCRPRPILYEVATNPPFGRSLVVGVGSARTADKGRYLLQLHTELG